MVAITSTYVHKESFAERVPLLVEFYANLTLFKEAAKLTEITSLKQAHKKWNQIGPKNLEAKTFLDASVHLPRNFY